MGEGDAPGKKDSEKLAALSAIYQLVQRGLVSTLTGILWFGRFIYPPSTPAG